MSAPKKLRAVPSQRMDPSQRMQMQQRSSAAPLSVQVMRSWMDGACGQAEVWNLFASQLGSRAGFRATRALETMLGDLIACAQPSLQRLPSGCACLTADEMMLARMIEAAGRDEIAHAHAEAAALIPADAVGPVVDSARELGAHLRRIDQNTAMYDDSRAERVRSAHTLH